MFKRIAVVSAVAAIGLAVAPAGADAAPAPKRPHFAVSHAKPDFGRIGRPAPHSLRLIAVSGRSNAKSRCGVWVCTWRTSNGGCLVWEKTACKIINPFD